MYAFIILCESSVRYSVDIRYWEYPLIESRLYTANSVAILTHKLRQNSIYPLLDHTWNMVLKSGIHIQPKIHTHWRKFSSLDYGSVQGTRHLPVTITGKSEAFLVTVNIISFTSQSLLTLSSSFRCNHDQHYGILFSPTNHFKYSLLVPNSTSLWTNLPLEAVNCTTLPMFKYYTLPLFL